MEILILIIIIHNNNNNNIQGTGIRGLMRGMATLPKVTRSY